MTPASPIDPADVAAVTPARGESSSPAAEPLYALTGIRFVAALGVLLFHYGAAFSERLHAPVALVTLLQNGNMGVSFFFVLSGFILTYTYQGKLASTSALAEYLVARFARIYPVYLFALMLALPVLVKPVDLSSAIKVLLMVQSWTKPSDTAPNAWITQAWTLSVEVFFYLAFPVLLLGIDRLKTTSATASAIAVGAAIWALGVPKIAPGTESIPLLPPSNALPLPVLRMLEFLLGMLACRIFLNTPRATWAASGGWKTWVVALSIVLILATSTSPHVASLATLLFPVLLIQLGAAESGLKTVLSTRLMILLGGASYALYITQGPIREWARLLMPAPIDAAFNPLIAVAFSFLLFVLWERPAQRWLRAAYRRAVGPKPSRREPAAPPMVDKASAIRSE